MPSPSFAIGIARSVGATTASVQLGASPALLPNVTIATHVTALVAGDKVLVMIPDPQDSSLTPVIIARLSGAATPYHAGITLGADAGAVLGLTDQQIDLDIQTANTFLRGPTSGAAADPVFGPLVTADLPTTRAYLVPLAAALTSTSWDGDAKATTDSGTIDLSAVFGAPAGIKAALVYLAIKDASVAQACALGPSVGNYALTAVTYLASDWSYYQGKIPCDANGDIYYKGYQQLDNVILSIWGYWL